MMFMGFTIFDPAKCYCPQCGRKMDNLKRKFKQNEQTIEVHRCTCGIRWNVWLDLPCNEEGYYLCTIDRQPRK